MKVSIYSSRIIVILSLLVAVLFSTIAINAKPPAGQVTFASGSNTVDNESYIDANQIFMFVTNHGSFGRDLSDRFGFDFGTFYPYGDIENIDNGAIISPLYAAGLWLGGLVGGQVRIALAEYSSEFVPGPMLNGSYQTDRPEFRGYKLYIDSLAGNPNADYLNWPVDMGAPVDADGQPLMRGDQSLWTVFNDADPNQHNNNSGETAPLGIEVHQSTWAFEESGTDTTLIPQAYPISNVNSSVFDISAMGIDNSVQDGDQYRIIVSFDTLLGIVWSLENLTTTTMLIEDDGVLAIDTIEGIQVSLEEVYPADWSYESADPPNISPVAVEDNPDYTGGRWFTGGQHGGGTFFGGVFIEPNFWDATSVSLDNIKPIEIKFRPMESYTDLNSDGSYTIGEPFVVDDPGQTQSAFMYTTLNGDSYEGFYPIPFTAWDISDTLNPRQLNVVIRDRDHNHAWNLHVQHQSWNVDLTGLPNNGDMRFNYTWIQNTDYDPTGTYYGDGTGGTVDFWSYAGGDGIFDAMWVLWLDDRESGGTLAEEGTFSLTPTFTNLSDTFLFTATSPVVDTAGPESKAVYIEYKLYNKGFDIIEDCYVGIWTDPDLGGAGDDLVGCDTLNDFIYCYNSNNADTYYGDRPPAIGFKFVRGPLVPEPGQVAYFGDHPIPDHKNLGMVSAITLFGSLDPDIAQETYYILKGLYRDGAPMVYNGDTITFENSGDPVTGTGDLDYAPDDRRTLSSSGPFTLHPGDSQYVLIKMAIGHGTDRLNSITKLREVMNITTGVPVADSSLLMATLSPQPQEIGFIGATETVYDTIIVGRVLQDIGDVNLSTVRINGSIVPETAEILSSSGGFGGEVMRLVFPADAFISGYGSLWKETKQTYTVSGEMNDTTPFFVTSTFTFSGLMTGDVTDDGVINLGDVTFLINYVFRNGPAPDPIEIGDCNDDGRVNIGDIVYLINYIFGGGPSPVGAQ